MARLTKIALAALALGCIAMPARAIKLGDKGAALHGNIQTDWLFAEDDAAIGAGPFKDKVLSNTYASLSFLSKYVDAGARLEFLEWPLPGYEDAKGWGVPNIYVKAKYKGFELTAGDFYEQFGAGFILRTYEERNIGIDNSIRGGRLKVNAIRGLRLTALGGVQRRYWDWRKSAQVYGADAEASIEDWAPRLAEKGVAWTVGASYVLKHESDEDIIVPGSDYRLNLPKTVGAFDVRTHFQKSNFGVSGEFAWKNQDPSFDNDYTYGRGTAIMLSGNYSRSGLSALVQVKRSENMSYRIQRSVSGISAMLNHMPAFSYQHTYSLPSLYPYGTQYTPGEWAFQGQFAYTFKRGTALGGRYGTKIRLNASYIRGLSFKDGANPADFAYGTNSVPANFFGLGENYYHDYNIQIEKRITKDAQLSFMYMNQLYNKTIVEGHGGDIKSNIFVLEGKFKLSRKVTLRSELQYLTTRQDQKDWAYGLVEVSVLPYLMFTVSDLWNCGDTGLHYYMAGVTGNYKANRLMLSYGRTRKGYNCSGGVCRLVPAQRGFQISYAYSF